MRRQYHAHAWPGSNPAAGGLAGQSVSCYNQPVVAGMKTSWDDEKQKRLDDLRRQETQRGLTETEQQELQALYRILDEEEAQLLAPALQRYDTEIQRLSQQIKAQEQIIHEFTQVLDRLARQRGDVGQRVQVLEAEYVVLKEEYRRLTGRELSVR